MCGSAFLFGQIIRSIGVRNQLPFHHHGRCIIFRILTLFYFALKVYTEFEYRLILCPVCGILCYVLCNSQVLRQRMVFDEYMAAMVNIRPASLYRIGINFRLNAVDIHRTNQVGVDFHLTYVVPDTFVRHLEDSFLARPQIEVSVLIYQYRNRFPLIVCLVFIVYCVAGNFTVLLFPGCSCEQRFLLFIVLEDSLELVVVVGKPRINIVRQFLLHGEFIRLYNAQVKLQIQV